MSEAFQGNIVTCLCLSTVVTRTLSITLQHGELGILIGILRKGQLGNTFCFRRRHL
jgi:hypothetical protein